MTEVFVPERKLVLQIPDCGTCLDVGFVESPTLDWHGRTYLGHGKCDCHICRSWPQASRRWAEQSGNLLPSEALEDLQLGNAQKHFALVACTECENGAEARRWQDDRPNRKPTGPEWAFHPAGWRSVRHDSAEGRELIAMYDANRDRRGGRTLTMADVSKMAKGVAFRHRMPNERAPSITHRDETRSDVERANEARRRAREAAEALAGKSAEAGR